MFILQVSVIIDDPEKSYRSITVEDRIIGTFPSVEDTLTYVSESGLDETDWSYEVREVIQLDAIKSHDWDHDKIVAEYHAGDDNYT